MWSCHARAPSLVLASSVLAQALSSTVACRYEHDRNRGSAEADAGDVQAAACALAETLVLALRAAVPRALRPTCFFRLPRAAQALLLEAWEVFVGGLTPEQVR